MPTIREYDILDDPERLRELYVVQGLTTAEIGELDDCADATVARYLRKHDIPVRSRGVRELDEHAEWVDHDTGKYYGAWDIAREKALERDNHKCQSCGATQQEHKEEYTNGLEVHHHEKKVSFEDAEDAHELDNLITLCRVCHAKYERGVHGPLAGIRW